MKKRIILSVLLLAVAGGGIWLIARSMGDGPHLRAAMLALDQRDFSLANAELAKHLKENPDDCDALLLSAQTLRRAGSFPLANAALREAENKKGPRDTIEFERRLTRLQQGDLAGAAEMFSTCEAAPNSPETPLILEALIEGSLKMMIPTIMEELEDTRLENRRTTLKADFARALAAANLWLNLRTSSSDRVQGFLWRGKIHALGREFPTAEKDFQQALEIDERNAEARLILAKSQMLHSPDQALMNLERLHRDDPSNEDTSFLVAVARHNLGRLDESAQILDSLLESYPNNVDILLERGQVALDKRQLDAAEHYLQKALALNPNRPESNRIFGQFLQMSGRHGEAKTHFDKSKQIEAQRRKKP